MFAVHGLLFNHEGIRRGRQFVTRKITMGVAIIDEIINDVENWRSRHGTTPVFKPIELGNLDAKRDWSDSEDFIKGIWLMLNQNDPKDYLVASGEMHSIREFVEKAFAAAGFDGEWVGEGVEERYVYRKNDWEVTLVKINPDFYRPAEVETLMGDPTDAFGELGWTPEGNFDTLVEKMVKHDIKIKQKKESYRLP